MNMMNRKAISPVIATVILVAVAITIAVAVSYWMSGIASSYTKFEKVEIQSALVTTNATGWVVSISLKNSGSAASTINAAYVNDRAEDATPGATNKFTTDIPVAGLSIPSGGTATVTCVVGNAWPVGAVLSSGTTVNIKLHSAGGMDYIKLVELI